VGFGDGEAFVPVAHSPALELSTSEGLMHWTPDGRQPIGAGPLAAAVSRATEAATRSVGRRV
jgi:hypothetical protein